jgi:hypothetical protein
LNRLKEGEHVCGGRGQFGKPPLWISNRLLKLWMRPVICGVFDLRSRKDSRKVEHPVLNHDNVREGTQMVVEFVFRTHE